MSKSPLLFRPSLDDPNDIELDRTLSILIALVGSLCNEFAAVGGFVAFGFSIPNFSCNFVCEVTGPAFSSSSVQSFKRCYLLTLIRDFLDRHRAQFPETLHSGFCTSKMRSVTVPRFGLFFQNSQIRIMR